MLKFTFKIAENYYFSLRKAKAAWQSARSDEKTF